MLNLGHCATETGHYFVGLDLGQARDYTAIAALQRAELTGPWDPVNFGYRKMAALRVRHLERVPLGTRYLDVVDRVRRVTEHGEVRRGRCHLAIDATGVGRPVVELFRDAGLGCTIFPATITGGEWGGSGDSVTKKDLVTGLQLLLQRGALQIADGMEHGPALVRELMQMEVRRTRGGREQFGVWKEGEHDDLVMAVALACWACRRVYPWRMEGDDGIWRRMDQEEWEAALKAAVGGLRVY